MLYSECTPFVQLLVNLQVLLRYFDSDGLIMLRRPRRVRVVQLVYPTLTVSISMIIDIMD